MKGDSIPSSDHLARLCYGKVIEDEQVLAAAFLPRPKDDYLSVNWLECLKCASRQDEIAEIRKRYSRFNLKRKDRIAILNVGVTCLKVAEENQGHRFLKAIHDPEPTDDSHSGLWGFSYDDMLIAELILLTVLNVVPAIETH